MNAHEFEKLITLLRTVDTRAEIILEEVPAPQKLATYAYSFSADVSNGQLGDHESQIASGRFVLLHEPGGQDTWEGEFRCVTFIRAAVDEAMQEDPLLPEVGWNWLLDSLTSHSCSYAAPSGTVTRVSSASFGMLAPRNITSEIEIRASWTPVIATPEEVMKHIEGWCNLMAEVAGLPPVADGVAAITSGKRR